MKLSRALPVIGIIGLLFVFGCSAEKRDSGAITVGIASDVETFNPLYAFNMTEGNITELMFLSAVQHRWDSTKGSVETLPMLAESWEWGKDSTSLVLNFREDIKWSDGERFTGEDFIFSYDLYSDPMVNSRLLGAFDNYYCNSKGHIDIDKSFELLSPFKVLVKFRSGSAPSLFDIDAPLIPKHIFEKIPRDKIPTSEYNFTPVTCGAYKLDKWKRNQYISLKADSTSFLYKEGICEKINFAVIPDYNTRLLKFENGELDFTEDIKPKDAVRLKSNEDIVIRSVKGREFDYIGWNNLDPTAYKNNGTIKTHVLFGDKRVREALTYCLDRESIVDEYLLGYGEIAAGPVSPIFISEYDNSLSPRKRNVEKAKELFRKAGWQDSDYDGILDKEGKNFSFKLNIPSGNPRRVFAANIFKNNLREVGVEAEIVTMEMGVFIDNLFSRSFDAWMVGWVVPIPNDLNISWNSNLTETPLNFAGYRNNEVDRELKAISLTNNTNQKNAKTRKIQRILNSELPYTYLYWIDNIVLHSSRIKGIDITPLGTIHHCWEWRITDGE